MLTDNETYVMINHEKYEFSFKTSEFWMADLDHTLKQEISYEVDDTIENFVAFHYNKWCIDPDKKAMYDELIDILGPHKGMIHMGFNPELLHYEFDGISVNEEDIITDDVKLENGFYRFKLKRGEDSFMFIPARSIDSYCEVDSYDNEETGAVETDYYYNTSRIDLFMKPEDKTRMEDFLYGLIPKMNKIYKKYGLPKIVH